MAQHLTRKTLAAFALFLLAGCAQGTSQAPMQQTAPAMTQASTMPELEQALRKADPAAELTADFNELVSSAANIAPASTAMEQDRAKAQDVRAQLQDMAGIARARDPNQRAAALNGAAFPPIDSLAARLDQNIGSRLSVDGRAGMVRDFKTIAQYMAVVAPGDAWYCQIRSLGSLVGC